MNSLGKALGPITNSAGVFYVLVCPLPQILFVKIVALDIQVKQLTTNHATNVLVL